MLLSHIFRSAGILSLFMLLISGCGRDDFSDKVPESADAVLFVNGSSLVKNAYFCDFLEKLQEDIALPKTSFRALESVTGYLFYFDSVQKNWGSVIRTANGQAQELYLFFRSKKGVRECKDDGILYLETGPVTIQLVSPDLMICRTGKPLKMRQNNPLMRKLRYENMMSAVFRKGEMLLGNSDPAIQFPGGNSLQLMTVNIPPAGKEFKIYLQGEFSDGKGAGQFYDSLLLLKNMLSAQLQKKEDVCTMEVLDNRVNIVLDSRALDQTRTEIQKKIAAEKSGQQTVPQKQQIEVVK